MTSTSTPENDPFGLFRPSELEDPYPAMARAREQAPVHFIPYLGGWIVSRYEDCHRLLRDPRASNKLADIFVAMRPEEVRASLTPVAQNFASWMLHMDPPDHTRLRGLLGKAFSPRLIEGLRPRIQHLVDETLDAAEAKGSMDAVQDFATMLPIAVIGEMLGAPREIWPKLKVWSDAVAGFTSRVTDGSPELLSRTVEAVAGFSECVIELMERRRSEPQDDFVSALVTASDQNGTLSDQEVVSNCVLLLFAGYETTTHLISNGVREMLRHPELFAPLREAPAEAWVTAVDEIVRFESPIARVGRLMLEDVELCGQRLKKGDLVVPAIAAANRDPAQFADPDRLNLGRKENRHLAFGIGPHYCIGAVLARMEGQIALGTLLRRFPRMTLAGEPRRVSSGSFRGFASLPVALG